MAGDSYTVKAGDSWAKIAGSIYGNERMYLELMQANGGVDLHPGVVINLPAQVANQDIFISNKQAAAVGMATSDQLQAAYGAGMTGQDLVAGYKPAQTQKTPGPLGAPPAPSYMPANYSQLATQRPSSNMGTSQKVGQGTLTPSPTGADRYKSGAPLPGPTTPATTHTGTYAPLPTGGVGLAPGQENFNYYQPATYPGQSQTTTPKPTQPSLAPAVGGDVLKSAQAKYKAGSIETLTDAEYKALLANAKTPEEKKAIGEIGLKNMLSTFDRALGYQYGAETGIQPPANAQVQVAEQQFQQIQTNAQAILDRAATGSMTVQDELALTEMVNRGLISQAGMDAKIAQNNDAKARGLGGNYNPITSQPAQIQQPAGGNVVNPEALGPGYWTPSGNFVPYNTFSARGSVGMRTLSGGVIGPGGQVYAAPEQGQPAALQRTLGQGWGTSGLTTGLVSWRIQG